MRAGDIVAALERESMGQPIDSFSGGSVQWTNEQKQRRVEIRGYRSDGLSAVTCLCHRKVLGLLTPQQRAAVLKHEEFGYE